MKDKALQRQGVGNSHVFMSALALQVAPIGDTEYRDGRDSDAFRRHPGAPARCPCLPENGPREKQRLAGVPKADADELREKDAKTQVEGSDI
jgi:hypothetical protein